VWSEDILNDAGVAISPEARALIQREGYRAVLSVPLLTKGDAHGALAAYWWEPHTPSAAEISIMTALAGQAATFEAIGTRELKGIPGTWELYRLVDD
jgi:GAF domain-containing protein